MDKRVELAQDICRYAHRGQLDRLGEVTEKDLARLEKYKKALALLDA